MHTRRSVLLTGLGLLNRVAGGQDAVQDPDPSLLVRLIQEKAESARQYTFDAVIDISRKTVEGTPEIIGHFTVKVSVAPEGKYLLWVGEKTNLEYLIASDGSTTWALVSSTNRYLEIAAAPAFPIGAPDVLLAGTIENGADPVLCSNLVLPALARLGRDAVALLEMNKAASITRDGVERQLPVVTILSRKDDLGAQNLVQLVLDPDALTVHRLTWNLSIRRSEEQPRFATLDVKFDALQIGTPPPPSNFVFNPGNAEKSDELPIPGLNAGSLVKNLAPAFELETLSHLRVRSTDVLGKTVVLGFLGDGCGPCVQQARALSEIEQAGKNLPLVVLKVGANQPGMHQRYGVRFVPTIVVIDPEGNVIRFLPGLQNAATLRSMLKGA